MNISKTKKSKNFKKFGRNNLTKKRVYIHILLFLSFRSPEMFMVNQMYMRLGQVNFDSVNPKFLQ